MRIMSISFRVAGFVVWYIKKKSLYIPFAGMYKDLINSAKQA